MQSSQCIMTEQTRGKSGSPVSMWNSRFEYVPLQSKGVIFLTCRYCITGTRHRGFMQLPKTDHHKRVSDGPFDG